MAALGRMRLWMRLGSLAIASAFVFLSLNWIFRQPPPPRKISSSHWPTLAIKDFGFAIALSGRDDSKRAASGSRMQEYSSTCRIPHLEQNSTEMNQFFSKDPPLSCATSFQKNWAFIDDQGKFSLIPERKRAYCIARVMKRESDDKTILLAPSSIEAGQRLPSDFAAVECTQGKEKWKLSMYSVVPSAEYLKKLKRVKKREDASCLSVYILSFDSMSQMTFRRKLPKTVRFLEEEMHAVILNGYNIVGDGTPQAFIPILTGGTEVELPLTRRRFKNASFVDDVYPFVWRNFSDAGYATLFAEDDAAFGVFNHRLKGFRQQPTDHYLRPFIIHKEIATHKVRRECDGTEPQHMGWFRYSLQFMREYSLVPRFALLHHGILTHDAVNRVGAIDDDFVAHLKKVKTDPAFEDTVVIVMADHGHRFARIRATHQGQLEERLPFYSITLPEKFRQTEVGKKALSNLRVNADRLSTPFDIHATFFDLIHMPKDFETIQDPSKSRSLSLLRPLPLNRTCAQAGIDAHWCTCLDWKDASSSSEWQLSLSIVTAVVAAMNDLLLPEAEFCAPLQLKKLIDTKRLSTNSAVLSYKQAADIDGFQPDLSSKTKSSFVIYQLKFSTTPGRAIYEATVRYEEASGKTKTRPTLHIDWSSLSHVNRYGDDPHCVIDRNFFLATFCVCHDRI